MTLGWWIEVVVKVGLMFFIVLTGVAYVSFAERRILAHMQSRIGPNRVGPQGLLQPAADALKLMTKETIIPEAADKILFLFGPVFALIPAIVAFSVIPFGESITLFGREIALHVTDVNIAVLFILALSSIGVYGIFLSAWASNNKFALIGGLRSSAQMISYELTMGLVIVAIVMLAGSFSLVDIVHAQAKVLSFCISRSGSSSSSLEAWPRSTAPRSICRKQKRSWWPVFTPNTPACASRFSPCPNTRTS